RRDARDRQRADDRQADLRPGLLAGRGDRQRVRRGGQRADPPGRAHRGRPGPLRSDADRERGGAVGREPRRPRQPAAGGRGRGHGGGRVSAGLATIGARRRNTDRIMRGVLLIATLIALVPLVLVIFYLLEKGLG